MRARPGAALLLVVASLLAAPRAHAAPVVAVVPADVPADRGAEVRAALGRSGYAEPTLLPAERLLEQVAFVSVAGLPGEEDCPSRVSIEAWRSHFEEARRRLQFLAFEDALAALVGLDVELVCLATPPATSDLFRLELAVAEAHTFLAQSGADAAGQAFHASEADAALLRAASFGAALSVPADVAPEVLAAYERVRARIPEDPPRVVVIGPGVRVGARVNGRPLPSGAFDVVAGTNLVQAAEGATVTDAARVRLGGGRFVIWLGEGGEAIDLAVLLDAVGRGARPDGREARVLDAVGEVLGAELVFGALVEGTVVWPPAGAESPEAAVDPAPPEVPEAEPEAPVESWGVVLGVGPTLGASDLDVGGSSGLGGRNVGGMVYARIAVHERLALAVSVAPWAVAAPVPAVRGGGYLFRATVPALVGLRYGPRTRRFALEAGLDLGVHDRGPDLAGTPAPVRFAPLGALAVGASGALADRVGTRVQAAIGRGADYWASSAGVALEGRW